MGGKERENWHLFWQEQLKEVGYKRPEAALLLAYYYLVAYARPWAESILGDKSGEVVGALEEMNLELENIGLMEQAYKIRRGLLEFDEKLLTDLPENVEFQEVKSFSVECARFLHETFIKVEAGKPTEGLTRNAGRAIAVNPNLALSYSEILSAARDKEKANKLLNRIYESHRGFFLALREI